MQNDIEPVIERELLERNLERRRRLCRSTRGDVQGE
jgi:hypothetical protein